LDEKLLILFLVLTILPMPYDFYLLYKAKFKTVGLKFMDEISEMLFGEIKVNRWSFDKRYFVEGMWNGHAMNISLGHRVLEIEFNSFELPKTKHFLVKYPKYRNGIFHIGKQLRKQVASSRIWDKSYSSKDFDVDLHNFLGVLHEIKSYPSP